MPEQKQPRRAIPADEKSTHSGVAKVITAEDSGPAVKLPPAQMLGSGIDLARGEDSLGTAVEDYTGEEIEITKSIFVPIAKSNLEEQTVTGVVLQPEVVDAQGDIMSVDVIRKAAHKFVSDYNKATKLGFMHKDFSENFDLRESYLAPMTFSLNGKSIKEGSWVLVVGVKNPKIWKMVKEGKLKGYSIGGKAKVKKLSVS